MATLRRAILVASAALLPLGVAAVVPQFALPAGIAYLATAGRWLVFIGTVASLLAVFVAELRPGAASTLVAAADSRAAAVGPRSWSAALLASATALALLLLPGYRWNATAFGGDEPKYLRMAESLYRDLDVDLSSETQTSPTLPLMARNLSSFLDSTKQALAGVFRASTPPADHRFNLGNWTLAGVSGGRYYVFAPGLPALIAPSLFIRDHFVPGRPPAVVPQLVLLGLWVIAFWQTTLLCERLSGSRLAGLAAALFACLSAPVFVGGFHFYPESAAAPIVPWALRVWLAPSEAGRQSQRARGWVRPVVLGLALGFLPWLHTKFLLLAVVLAALNARRLWSTPRWLVLSSVPFSVLLAALLVFDHRVTGLFRFDALYVRYGSSIYEGASAFFSVRMLNGLVTALFGARDGLLVMAPVLVGGVLALPAAARRQRTETIALLAVFGSLWIAAAVHEGGAPGPPGRLLAPVVCIVAAWLAVGLVELSRSVAYLASASALALVTLAITAAMLEDWRRTVNPYRDMFETAAVDFARDLPEGPGRDAIPIEERRPRDLVRGLWLAVVLALCAYALDRRAKSEGTAWSLARFHASAWTTLTLATAVLSALGP
jgi:hypothetical protein